MRAYRLAYDGRPFHGFQRQPDVPTVEDAVLDGLDALGVTDGDPPPEYAAAGRTDRGVSAVAQTIAFEAPDWLGPAALNAELPASVWAWATADAPAGFHATHDALAREYVYHLYAPDADAARAGAACEALAGRHDFHNLTPDEEGTVRELAVDCEPDGDYLLVTFHAGGFARQLVRRAVSVVSAVAAGEADLGRVERVLAAKPLDGPAGVAPAPPVPLVLTDVDYGLRFDADEAAAADATAAFESRRRRVATRATVAGTLRDGVG
jgi:tRNA pseudouridine38-40 synthase